MHAVGTSAANVREAFRKKLRHIPILSVYAVVALVGLVALIVGMIGVHAVYTTNKQVRALEEVANRAFFAAHANGLIYAVVMDSRGVYMSSEAADRAKYGAGIMKFLAELEANMVAWKEHVTPKDREDFARAQARMQEFIRFRTELVRLGNEVGQAAAREWGDNDANRTNREALNRAIETLANANYAELAQLRAWINAYSTRQFVLAKRDHGRRSSARDSSDRSDGRTSPKGRRHPARVKRGVSGGSPNGLVTRVALAGGPPADSSGQRKRFGSLGSIEPLGLRPRRSFNGLIRKTSNAFNSSSIACPMMEEIVILSTGY